MKGERGMEGFEGMVRALFLGNRRMHAQEDVRSDDSGGRELEGAQEGQEEKERRGKKRRRSVVGSTIVYSKSPVLLLVLSLKLPSSNSTKPHLLLLVQGTPVDSGISLPKFAQQPPAAAGHSEIVPHPC